MAANMYNRGIYDLLSQALWVSATDHRMLLLDDAGTYTFNADHDFVSDLTPGSNESSGTGYARKTIDNQSATIDDTGDQVKCDADDVSTYTGADFGDVQAAVVFRQVTTDADSPLICYLDGASFPVTTNGGDLTIQFHADGVFIGT